MPRNLAIRMPTQREVIVAFTCKIVLKCRPPEPQSEAGLHRCGAQQSLSASTWCIASARARGGEKEKDRKSNSLHRNIPSPRGPVKSQRKPRLSSGGSLCGRNLPAKGWRDGFSGGRWVGLWKAGNGGASSPGGCFTRTPAGRTRTLVRAGRRDRRRNLPRQRWHAP